jgi:hypothetical protein
MEGALELRAVADAIRVARSQRERSLGDVLVGTSRRGKNGPAKEQSRRQRFGNDVRLCIDGFTRGARDDVLLVCEEYGIMHQERAGGATHVVVPFSREDISLLGMVPERYLPNDAQLAGAPVVTVDFLLDLIDAIKKFDEVLGRQTKAYAVVGRVGGVEEIAPSAPVRSLGSLGSPGSLGSLGDGAVGVADMTDMTARCSIGSLKIFGNEMYGAGSLARDSSLTRVEVGAGDGSEARDDFNHSRGENVDVNVQTPCTTPGSHADLDLKNFAAISSVTPLEMGQDLYDVEDDFGGLEEELRTGLVLQGEEEPVATTSTTSMTSRTVSTSTIGPEDIIPGDLLLRAPRNNKVRQRHGVVGGRVIYTDSITMRPKGRDIVEIDVKASRNVAMQSGELIIKPLFFYKIRGEGWRVEFRRFFRARDLPARDLGLPTDLDPAELFLSTAIEGSSLHALADDVRKVCVDRLSAARRQPVLQMETAGSGAPAWFYRHEYDVETENVLYRV